MTSDQLDAPDNPSISDAPFKIYNIGGGKPVRLMNYIKEIEINLSRKAKINYMSLQKGDIKSTYCSTQKLNKEINYIPKTSIKVGIKNFITWFRKYHKRK